MNALEDLKRLLDEDKDGLAKLELHQIRYRIEQLKDAGLVKTTKGPYQKLLLDDSERDTLLRLIKLEQTCKTVSNAIAELKSELIRQGKQYEAMSKAELLDEVSGLLGLIAKQNREIEQLKSKVSQLMESRKPVPRRGFLQLLRGLFTPARS